MSWTDERVDALRKLWAEGLSASQIAGQLGGVSRNAVIGKVHRLGLEGRAAKAGKEGGGEEPDAPGSDAAGGASADAADGATPVRPGDAPISDPVAVDPSAPDASTPDEPPLVRPTPLQADNDEGEPVPDADPGDDVVVPVPRRLKLVQLTERTCKWPIGDPMHDDFHFCGHEAEEGRPYCEYHSGLAFQPASERRRVR